MEPMIFIGGVIVVAGGIWTVVDLLQDAGLLTEVGKQQANVRAALRPVQASDHGTSAPARPVGPVYCHRGFHTPSR